MPWRYWRKNTSSNASRKCMLWFKETFWSAWIIPLSSSSTIPSRTKRNSTLPYNSVPGASSSACSLKSIDSRNNSKWFLTQGQVLRRANSTCSGVPTRAGYYLPRVINVLCVVSSLRIFSLTLRATSDWPISDSQKCKWNKTMQLPCVGHPSTLPPRCYISKATASLLTGGA